MSDFVTGIVKQRKEIYCSKCDVEVYKCDNCDGYFELGEKIICATHTDLHYCEGCIDNLDEESD